MTLDLKFRKVGVERIELAHEIGAMLIQAQKQLGRGNGWPAWVEEHCGIKERQARNYMAVAERWTEIQRFLKRKRQPGAEITLKSVLKDLSKPRRPIPPAGDDQALVVHAADPSDTQEHLGPDGDKTRVRPDTAHEETDDAPAAPAAERRDGECRTEPGRPGGEPEHVPTVPEMPATDRSPVPPTPPVPSLLSEGPGAPSRWFALDGATDVALMNEFTARLREALRVLPRFHQEPSGGQRDAHAVTALWAAVSPVRDKLSALLKATSPRALTRCESCKGDGVIGDAPCGHCGGLGMSRLE